MAAFDKSAVEFLVIRATQGERAAYDEIYSGMWEFAFNFVMRLYGGTLSREEARDVVQEAFVTAWEKLPSLREPKSFNGWFFRILVRKCLAACRLVVVRAVLDDPNDSRFEALMLVMPEFAGEVDVAGGRGEPYRHLVRTELVEVTRARIMRVYEKLTGLRRLVFVARFVDLLDERAIERSTRLPIGTIRSAIAKITELLRKELGAAEFREVPVVERKVAFVEALAGWPERKAKELVS